MPDLKMKRCRGCGEIFITLNPKVIQYWRYCRDCHKLLKELQAQGLGLNNED